MLHPTKGFAVKDGQGFEKAITIQEATIMDRDDRLFFGHELAVDERDQGKVGELECWSGAPRRSASKNPRALARVSSYSAVGSESATIPAPAWNQAALCLKIAARMMMLNWLSRLNPR